MVTFSHLDMTLQLILCLLPLRLRLHETLLQVGVPLSLLLKALLQRSQVALEVGTRIRVIQRLQQRCLQVVEAPLQD